MRCFDVALKDNLILLAISPHRRFFLVLYIFYNRETALICQCFEYPFNVTHICINPDLHKYDHLIIVSILPYSPLFYYSRELGGIKVCGVRVGLSSIAKVVWGGCLYGFGIFYIILSYFGTTKRGEGCRQAKPTTQFFGKRANVCAAFNIKCRAHADIYIVSRDTNIPHRCNHHFLTGVSTFSPRRLFIQRLAALFNRRIRGYRQFQFPTISESVFFDLPTFNIMDFLTFNYLPPSCPPVSVCTPSSISASYCLGNFKSRESSFVLAHANEHEPRRHRVQCVPAWPIFRFRPRPIFLTPSFFAQTTYDIKRRDSRGFVMRSNSFTDEYILTL